MKTILVIFTVLWAVLALPADPEEAATQLQPPRPLEYYLLTTLSNLGVLSIKPRYCDTTSDLLPKGQCARNSDCQRNGGAVAGSCARAGSCCVYPSVCGSTADQKVNWFVNKLFPNTEDSLDRSFCEMTIVKYSDEIKQVRFDLDSLVLSKGIEGECITDQFRIVRSVGAKEVELAPVLCGENSGQHLIIDMPEDGKLKVQVKTAGKRARAEGQVDQQWRIAVTQLDETERVPSNCLQYYDSYKGTLRSLNFHSSTRGYMDNQEYDICFNTIAEVEKKENEGAEDGITKSCRRSITETDISHKLRNKRAKRDTEETEGVQHIDMFASSGEGVEKQIQKVVSQLQELRKNAPLNAVLEEAKVTEDDKAEEEQVVPERNVIRSHSEESKTPVVADTPVESAPEAVESSQLANVVEVDLTMVSSPEITASNEVPKLVVKPVEETVATKPLEESVAAVANEVQNEEPVKEPETTRVVVSKPVEQPEAVEAPEPSAVAAAVEPPQESNAVERDPTNALDCGGSYILAHGEKQAYVCGVFDDGDLTRSSAVRPEISKEFNNVERISIRATENPETTMRFSMDYVVTCRTQLPEEVAVEPTQGGRFNLWQFLLGRPSPLQIANN